MRRRTYLTLVPASTFTALAGCLGDDDDDADDTQDETDGDTDETDDDGTEQADDDEENGDADIVSPATAFEYDFDVNAETLEITHVGGDSFSANRVSLTGEGITDEGYWYELGEAEPEDTISAGDSIEVGAQSDFDIELLWEADDGTEVTIGDARGPDT